MLERLNTWGAAAAREYSREGELLVASPGLPGSPDWDRIPGLAKAAGLAHSVDEEAATLRDGGAWARVTRSGRVGAPAGVPLRPRRRLARLAASILLMASACAGEQCMLCASSCPEDAVQGPAVTDPEKCTGRRACVNACPATNAAEQGSTAHREPSQGGREAPGGNQHKHTQGHLVVPGPSHSPGRHGACGSRAPVLRGAAAWRV
ncbi:hypothetical protein [Pyrodictium abyssi]|uniref:4Fe-4S ferredoxin-type domain-containing protein n=1 Tax=Pyrodictium abyssi TaxID=54256 RepID=A0ABN6ZSW0_9CREN|nr:hypothetical protein PABY_06180 [Pyrodictium abyssi]